MMVKLDNSYADKLTDTKIVKNVYVHGKVEDNCVIFTAEEEKDGVDEVQYVISTTEFRNLVMGIITDSYAKGEIKEA